MMGQLCQPHLKETHNSIIVQFFYTFLSHLAKVCQKESGQLAPRWGGIL